VLPLVLRSGHGALGRHSVLSEEPVPACALRLACFPAARFLLEVSAHEFDERARARRQQASIGVDDVHGRRGVEAIEQHAFL
jgi:hypothetical protein